MRRIARSKPSPVKLRCKRKETGSAGIDFGIGAARAPAVVVTLIVAVDADVPLNGKDAGVAVQFAPVGAPEHANVTVPLKPFWGVKASE
jgi:hypothetical protein